MITYTIETDTVVVLLQNLALFLLVGGVLFLISHFLRFFVRKVRKVSPDTVNGINILITFASTTIWVIVFLTIFDIDPTYLLGGSALFVTVIGLSSSMIGANAMGGLYILITRPYGVGDIISVSNQVGLVTEITLNYTKVLRLNRKVVLIPNGNIVNSMLVNTKTFVKHTHIEPDQPSSGEKGHNGSIVFNLPNITVSMGEQFLDRLSTPNLVNFHMSVEYRPELLVPSASIDQIGGEVEKICAKYHTIFGYKPEFFYPDLFFRLSVSLVIVTTDTSLIYNHYSDLLEDLNKAIYEGPLALGGN